MTEGRPATIGQTFWKTLVVVGTVVGLFVLFQLRSILLVLFGAILFASTVRPVVLYLTRRGVRPIVAILLIYLVFVLALLAAGFLLIPTLLARSQELVQNQDRILQAVRSMLHEVRLLAFLQARIWIPLPSSLEMAGYLEQLQTTGQERVSSYLFDGFRALTELLLLLVVAFYWLTERDRIEDLGVRLLPLRNRERFLTIFNDIESTLGAWTRGQGILSLSIAVLAFAGLAVLGVPYALLLAVFAGLTELIPFVGPVIGMIPAVLVALLISPQLALFVTIYYIVIQQIESNVLVPKVMERQVGLSPLVVILALAAGNVLAGLLGALIAVPIAAALQILVRHLVVTPTVEAHAPTAMEGGLLVGEVTLAPSVETTGPAPVVPSAPAGTQPGSRDVLKP
jgi:predicted PurR-regulated permease PerM